MFYWLARHGESGGPSDMIGDSHTPEKMRSKLASLRKDDAEKELYPKFLFEFLQRHEPHNVNILYPQTFLFAVSLLTPAEFELAKTGVPGSFEASQTHPNAVTMRSIHSPEAAAANAAAWPVAVVEAGEASTTTKEALDKDDPERNEKKRKAEEEVEEKANKRPAPATE